MSWKSHLHMERMYMYVNTFIHEHIIRMYKTLYTLIIICCVCYVCTFSKLEQFPFASELRPSLETYVQKGARNK